MMSSATSTTEFAPPFPSSSSFHHHRSSYRSPEYKHIHMPFFVHADATGLIHQATSTPAPIKGQPTQKRMREFQARNVLESNPYACVASLLQACTDINAAKQVHAHMLRSGFDQNVYLLTELVSKYVMCGSMEDARQIFDKLCSPKVFSWNVMIRGYAIYGPREEALTLYYRMQKAGIHPNKFTFPFVLKACAGLAALKEGKEIHDCIARSGLVSDVFVGTALVDMYAKCGSIGSARQLFDKMSNRNGVSWNAMIAGYAQNGHANEALTLFGEMQLANMKPDPLTMVSVLQACAQLGALQHGKWIHGYVIRCGLYGVFVGTAVIDMYAKCGRIETARQLFDRMSKRDVVSWNAMIAGYAQNGYPSEALTLFNQMQLANMKPSSITMVSVLKACAHSGALQQGKWIHDYTVQTGLESDIFVRNSLIDMYAKCGSLEVARKLFDNMPIRDVVSWNAMICGYVQNGHANKALTLFHQMQLADIRSNSVTVISVLQAYSQLAALLQGKWIHGYIIRSGLESEVFVGNSLIDMYAKCGSIEIAYQLFDKMSERDVVSWNAMIAGYGMHGHGEDALALYAQMQQTGMKPNVVTFVGVLNACSRAGLVDEGWNYFRCMGRDYGITPRAEHYACMVDLLGRSGRLDEAHDFIKRMPLEPDGYVWGALLGACRTHCNIELGEWAAEQIFELEPESVGYYVLLSNIYAASGRWDDVAKMRAMMNDRGLKKTPGCSWIEVHNRVHSFLVGDKSHPQSDKIYATLETLSGQMEEAGYVPNTNFVLHDVEEEAKEYMLGSHSEKLAIAFGLINTSPGTPIQIVKNLRVCGDCHSATKFISKIVRREITVRDASRFHRFKDGLCSCGDYW